MTEIELASLFGANKEYIEREIPHISSLMRRRLDEVIEQSEVVVLTKRSEEYRAALEQGNRLALIGLLFPVVGAGLLVAAVRATWRERKFGVSVLELFVAPGDLGRVIGRQGRTASALRTLASATAEHHGAKATLEIREPGE